MQGIFPIVEPQRHLGLLRRGMELQAVAIARHAAQCRHCRYIDLRRHGENKAGIPLGNVGDAHCRRRGTQQRHIDKPLHRLGHFAVAIQHLV